MNGWSHPLGWLVPGVLLVIAAVFLLSDIEFDACTPQDPVRVRVGDTIYAIPAVLLPILKPAGDVEPEQRMHFEASQGAYSRHGTKLRWWWCETEGQIPIDLDGFSINARWIAEAVAEGEMSYRFLPDISGISIRKGRPQTRPIKDGNEVSFLSTRLRITCNERQSLPGMRDGFEVTGTQCSFAPVSVSPDTALSGSFWVYETRGVEVGNARENWPGIARELEHLIRSMQQPAS